MIHLISLTLEIHLNNNTKTNLDFPTPLSPMIKIFNVANTSASIFVYCCRCSKLRHSFPMNTRTLEQRVSDLVLSHYFI